jgi:predicted RNase H-like nuclease
MREVLIGFDSAWSDKKPGAICAYILEGQCGTFQLPRHARFSDAVHFINEMTTGADYVLIAMDQPTVVRNDTGCRPVERVAASLLGKLGSGVQPARRGGRGAPMFGEMAPIWDFLKAVRARQNPIDARTAATGRFLMEVFLALALPAIVPAIEQRSQAAKYNPGKRRKFDLRDWKLVASGVARFAQTLGASNVADWLERQASIERPRKAHQDQLDAAICLVIALACRRSPGRDCLWIGDEKNGYIATIVSAQTREVLVRAAGKHCVDIDRVWEGSAVLLN